MSYVQFTFPSINSSLQVGDILYYTATSDVEGWSTNFGDIIQLGPVYSVQNAPVDDMNGDEVLEGFLITCDIPDNAEYTFLSNQFLFFSKDNTANMSSALGYYGEVKFKNNSKIKAELFATACEVSESSK